MSHVDTASSYGTDRHEPYLQIAAALAVPLANLYADAGDMPEYGDFSDGTNETRSRRGGDGGEACTFMFKIGDDPSEEYNLIYNSYGTDSHEPYLQIAAALAAQLANLYADAGDMPEYGDEWDGAEDQAGSIGYWGPWMSTTGYLPVYTTPEPT